jgi:hypothetical protein
MEFRISALRVAGNGGGNTMGSRVSNDGRLERQVARSPR